MLAALLALFAVDVLRGPDATESGGGVGGGPGGLGQPNPLPQPVPKPKPAEPKPAEPKPKPPPVVNPGTNPDNGPKTGMQPFGVDAGPSPLVADVVKALNGVVWAPYEFIVLSGSDMDLWPPELLALPHPQRMAMVEAQYTMALGTGDESLECRVRGACDGKTMANVLQKPVTRSAFVAYHLWLAAMQVKGGDSATKQVPSTDDEKKAMVGAHATAKATLLQPDLVA